MYLRIKKLKCAINYALKEFKHKYIIIKISVKLHFFPYIYICVQCVGYGLFLKLAVVNMGMQWLKHNVVHRIDIPHLTLGQKRQT